MSCNDKDLEAFATRALRFYDRLRSIRLTAGANCTRRKLERRCDAGVKSFYSWTAAKHESHACVIRSTDVQRDTRAAKQPPAAYSICRTLLQRQAEIESDRDPRGGSGIGFDLVHQPGGKNNPATRARSDNDSAG